MKVLGYQVSTAAGQGVDALMQALHEGRDCSQSLAELKWKNMPSEGRVCLMERSALPVAERFRNQLQSLLSQIPELSRLSSGRTSLVIASTKGATEDGIWQMTNEQSRRSEDFMTPLLPTAAELLKKQITHLDLHQQLVISNACASSHVAIEFAQDLFWSDQADFVVVVAADFVGPFVANGFSSLKLLSKTRNRPFDGERDGLQLGEAIAVLVLSKDQGPFHIRAHSNTEGSSITRPSAQGAGLVRAIRGAAVEPDFIVAHGTGTRFNDQAEDEALSELFREKNIPVINTKWSIGHTLGASGAVDLIAACETLRSQKLFAIGNSSYRDLNFRMNYRFRSELSDVGSPRKDHSDQGHSLRKALITSLGFGGIHAALAIEVDR